MDEHEDDLTSEVAEDAGQETEHFPVTAEEFEDDPEGEEETPRTPEDESEL